MSIKYSANTKFTIMRKIFQPNILFIFIITIIILSILNFGWITTWNSLRVPAMLPPHFDLRFYQYGAMAIENDFNPLRTTHAIWLKHAILTGTELSKYFIYQFKLSHFLKLYNEYYFLVFANTVIIIYLFCCYKIISINKKSYWILILFLSSGPLLAIERTNNDLIIFILLYWSAIYSNIVGMILSLLAISIEFWPAVAAISFIKNKKKIFLFFIIILFFIYNYNNLLTLGEPEIGEGLSFGSKFFSYLLSPLQLQFTKHYHINLILISLTFITLIREFKFFKLEFKKKPNELEERLFLMGGVIYCVLFIIASNYDYKLIFLIFSIPYLRKIKNIFQKYLILISILISSNLLWINSLTNLKISTIFNSVFKCIVFIILLNLLIRYFVDFYKNNSLKKIFF